MKRSIAAIISIVIALGTPVLAAETASKCPDKDTTCKTFEKLVHAEQPEKVVAQYDAKKQYSAEAKRYIGEAYLALASRDDVKPEQEEGYYRKALEVGHSIAYMGLYFMHVQKDEEKALGFLREYVKTQPQDTVPYAILGETELIRKNYAQADTYLRQAKKVAHAHSPRVDWMLFQANYLLKNYAYAAEMFESAVTKGTFNKELKALSTDQRFKGIEKQQEFKKHLGLLTK